MNIRLCIQTIFFIYPPYLKYMVIQINNIQDTCTSLFKLSFHNKIICNLEFDLFLQNRLFQQCSKLVFPLSFFHLQFYHSFTGILGGIYFHESRRHFWKSHHCSQSKIWKHWWIPTGNGDARTGLGKLQGSLVSSSSWRTAHV